MDSVVLNTLLFVLEIFVCLGGVLLVYRWFGRVGLIAWLAMSMVIANTMTGKAYEIVGGMILLGAIPIYSSTFLATDVLAERYGEREARKAVWMGFVGCVMLVLLGKFIVWYDPLGADDVVHQAYEVTFGMTPAIIIASLTAYLVSQNHDIWAFEKWKKLTRGRFLWLRNNASTMVSQFIDALVFTTVFMLLSPELQESVGWEALFTVILSTYVVKLLIAVLDTPFIYYAVRLKVKEK